MPQSANCACDVKGCQFPSCVHVVQGAIGTREWPLLVSAAPNLHFEVLQLEQQMETTTPDIAAKVENLNLTKSVSTAPAEPTQAATPVEDTANRTAQDATSTVDSRTAQTSRFPTSARNPGREGHTNVETKIEDFFSSQNWAESARNAVREHPLAVVGVALVAGLLIGRL